MFDGLCGEHIFLVSKIEETWTLLLYETS